jgi:type IV pilus assembly protein PilE
MMRLFAAEGTTMNRVRGYTLLELMIVVSVIAVLAIIAFPSFIEQMRKSKRAEGAQAISNLQLQLEKYRSYCPTYVNTATCLDSDGDGTVDANEPLYPSVTSTYYTVAISGQSATAYVITATKKASFPDPKCGNLTMTYSAGASTAGVSSGDADYCWRKK